MHYDEGRLLAYLDEEISAPERAEVAAHLTDCDECRGRLADVRADRDAAASALASLQPAAEVVALPARPSAPVPEAPARRSAWSTYVAVAAAAALIVGAFAFAPVRSAAADLLRIFRVQNVQTVTLSQADLESIQTALKAGTGHIDLKSLGEVWIDGVRTPPKPVALAAAQAAVDFPVVLPADAGGAPVITLQPAQSYRFKLHVPAINAALKAYGSDRTLPDSVDAKVFAVNLSPVVTARYGSDPVAYKKALAAGATPGAPPVFVGEGRGPELVVPEGVDAAQLRDVLVNLPFLPQSVRDQLTAMKDWQSTLIIPNIDGTARPVTIDGTAAILVSPKSAARDLRGKLGPLPDSATIIWNQDGVVRAVGGPISEEKATGLAKSMMR